MTENLEKSPENVDEKLFRLMENADSKVKEMAPIISYLQRKLEEYKKKKKHDSVHLVGSIGNNLYFPEKLPDNSYQVELDILYSRELPNVPLPVIGETTPVASLVIETKSNDDKYNSKFKTHSCLLEVLSVDGDIDDYNKSIFLETLKNGKVYLNSSTYKGSIPQKFEPTILREREIVTFGPPLLLPLYRTFKTDLLTLNDGNKCHKFRILMDKVAAIKAPWPSEASPFISRNRMWPERSIIHDVINDGCLLIHKPTSNGETYNIEWKMTFSLSEQRLTQQFSYHQKYLFILLKLVKRKYLDFGTYESGESRSGLTTYHMKTIYFWMVESEDLKIWSESPLTCLNMFFGKLKHCLESETCPHFFMPEVNIMSELWKYRNLNMDEFRELEEGEPMKNTLIEVIDRILDRPQDFYPRNFFRWLMRNTCLSNLKKFLLLILTQ